MFQNFLLPFSQQQQQQQQQKISEQKWLCEIR